MKQSIIVVVGPTASGKTEVGIRLAKAFDGEVVCADSRTIYKGMDIGTAKVQGEKGSWKIGDGIGTLFEARPIIVEGVAHWGIDLIEPDVAYSAAEFQTYADKKIAEIIHRGKTPILVGGTGLYVRAVVDRPTFSNVEPDEHRRTELEAMTDDELAAQLVVLDPDALGAIDMNNRRRVVRAIEILEATGQPLAMSRVRAKPIYDAVMIGCDVELPELVRRIDQRVDGMVASGLIDEARKLFTKYGAAAPGLSSIGYKQLGEFFAGTTPLREAIERIKTETRQYAKRQKTWWKDDERIVWVKSVDDAIAKVAARGRLL